MIFHSHFSLIYFNFSGDCLLEKIAPRLFPNKLTTPEEQKQQLRREYCDLIDQSKSEGCLTSTYNVLFSSHPSGCHSRELKRQKHKRRKWPVLMNVLWDHFQPCHPTISHLNAVPQNQTCAHTHTHTYAHAHTQTQTQPPPCLHRSVPTPVQASTRDMLIHRH